MLWALTWSLSTCGSPHRYFLSGVNVVTVLALVILYYYFKKHLSNNHQGTLKKKKKKKLWFIALNLEGIRHVWDHIVRSQVDREKTWDSVFIRVKGGILRFLWVCCGEFKT